jgi:pyruvate/2-oxoacid:ferredoxin oxidoreductase alpha subunit
MLKQIEGSRAVAEAVAMCRPQVICAYPITPQTHIVEALSAMVKKEQLKAEFLNVESEFAAMSVAIGASAAGARAYTATASQGLLYMSEAVWNAAGLGLPIVMTVATPSSRATSSCLATSPVRCSTRPTRSRSAPWSAPKPSPRSATWPSSACGRPST